MATADYLAREPLSNRNPALTAKVLELYFDEKLSPVEVGAKLGITRWVVRHHIEKAGRKLRSKSEAMQLAKLGYRRTTLRMVSHPDEDPASSWMIARLKCQNKSNREIASELNRSQPTIFLRLRRMGFPDGRGVTIGFSFGEVFDQAALRRLQEMSGLNVATLAGQLHMPFDSLHAALRGKRNKHIYLETVRKADEWRVRLFRHLMSDAVRHPGRENNRFSQSRVVLTFLPNLRERALLLTKIWINWQPPFAIAPSAQPIS